MIEGSGSVPLDPWHFYTDPVRTTDLQIRILLLLIKILRFLLYKCTHVYKHIPLHAEPCGACYSKPVLPAFSCRSQNGGVREKIVIKYNIAFRNWNLTLIQQWRSTWTSTKTTSLSRASGIRSSGKVRSTVQCGIPLPRLQGSGVHRRWEV